MKKAILFGASSLGRDAYNILKNKYDIIFFCDNDKEKLGKKFCNKMVISPLELREHEVEEIIITSIYFIEILNQLRRMGLNNIKIFFMDGKCGLHYKILDSNQYFYEELHIDKKFKEKYLENFNLLYNIQKKDKFRIKINSKLKKVLIIAYFFPPLGGAGTQRTLKFVKYLREFGWEPIVVTCGKNNYGIYDNSLLNEIPKGVHVIRIDDNQLDNININKSLIQQNINLYYGLISNENLINEYIRKFKNISAKEIGNYILPDKYIFWASEVLKNIEEIININDIHLIYSTSAPYSDHIIGYYLKKKYNKPWVTDFRDEWTNNGFSQYIHTSLKYKMEYSMEKSIVSFSNKILVTTPVSKENYIKLFNLSLDKVKVITNGFDEEDFDNLNRMKKNKKFKIIHNGSLYGKRVPNTFIEAMNELIEDNLIGEKDIEVIFVGSNNVNSEDMKKYNLFKNIKFISYKKHKDSLKLSNCADALLLIVGMDEKCSQYYPGKIFEYLRLFKPIISLSPQNGATDRLLNQLKVGYNVEYNDLKGIKNVIFRLFNDWKNNTLSKYLSNEEIEKFKRKNLTKLLAKTLDELFDNYI